ncbi:MAG: universal stress protein [Pseudolabrys sp.]|nr:universal stress protein [Pseudolabrys sp.]
MNSTLETALLLARKFHSYVEGIALLSQVNSFTSIEPLAAIPFSPSKENVSKATRLARGTFEKFMQDHHVSPSRIASAGPSFGWQDETAKDDRFVGRYGRVFDIIVLGRPGVETGDSQMSTVEAALFESGRPILLAPPRSLEQIGKNVLVVWNCSAGQARTISLTMPILQQADRVFVTSIVGGIASGPTSEQLIQYFQAHGILAELHTVSLKRCGVAEAILKTASLLGCDLLINGADTQGRFRRMIYGSTTRHVLANAPLPVFMAR